MNDASRDDDALRAFLATVRGDCCFEGVAEEDARTRARERFTDAARKRLVTAVQRRLLAEIGVMTDAAGITLTAVEVLEDEAWGKRRTWLLVGPEPWTLLGDLVVRRVRRSYRASVARPKDAAVLAGIAAASRESAL